MDHYLTIYRKDYLWPNLPGKGGEAGGGAADGSGPIDVSKLSGEELAFYKACLQKSRPPDCRCPQYSGREMPQLPPGKEGGWSRNEVTRPRTMISYSRTFSGVEARRRYVQCIEPSRFHNGKCPVIRDHCTGNQHISISEHTKKELQVSVVGICLRMGTVAHKSVKVMGPLLDPKLYPVKVGASPETSSSHYDQPNAFLDKLQAKYPMLYSILQGEASAELKQRIDRDRNKTTYQVDYCESGPGAKFEGLQRAQDDSGTGPCSQPIRLPGDPCRVGPKVRMATPGTISKQQKPPASEPRASTCETSSAVPPMGKTEYQDNISKLGGIIMRDKLHRAK